MKAKSKNYENPSATKTHRHVNATKSSVHGAQLNTMTMSKQSSSSRTTSRKSSSPNSSPQSSPYRRLSTRKMSSYSDDCSTEDDDSPFHLLTLSGCTVALIVILTIAIVDGWLPFGSHPPAASAAGSPRGAIGGDGKSASVDGSADGDSGFLSFLSPYSFLSLIGESQQQGAPVDGDGNEIKLLPAVAKDRKTGYQQKPTGQSKENLARSPTPGSSSSQQTSPTRADEDFNAKKARIKEKVKAILDDDDADLEQEINKPKTNNKTPNKPSPNPTPSTCSNQPQHQSFLDDESTQVYMLDQEEPYEEIVQTETVFRCWEECNKRAFCVNFSVRLTDAVDGALLCVLSSKEKFSRAAVLAEREQQLLEQQQNSSDPKEDPLLKNKSDDEELRLQMLNEYLKTGSIQKSAPGFQDEPEGLKTPVKKTSGFFNGPPAPFYAQQASSSLASMPSCGCF